MMYNRANDDGETTTDYEAPSALALLSARSVKDRIWVFLYESLNRDVQEGGKRISIFNEVDFYNICRDDLIKSKKDKYKPIKAALKKLTEEGDVVKVNIKGDPWKSRDEEAWYHFRTSKTNQGLPDEYLLEQYKKNLDQEKLIIKLYNRSFNADIKPEQYHHPNNRSENVYDKQWDHFLDFMYAMHELIEIFNRPDIRLPFEERIDRGMIIPKVSLTYLPGPAFMEKFIESETKKILKNQRKLISKH